ncbi:MAG: nucleotide pyrophosphohydrolase [Gammaproteobacteria bacterium]|nr:nucleotide pyrophosphohydrolase [Gammaproteobacteria bacterium]
MSDSIEILRHQLSQFAKKRDWEQFHSPKNLSMALIAEVAELIEHFQWLTEEASYNLEEPQRTEVGLELADIFIYLIRIADQLDVNLISVAQEKMAINEQRFPVSASKDSANAHGEPRK